MILLAGFLDVLFRALVSVGLALGCGGVVFALCVLMPVARGEAGERALARVAALSAAGALLAAAAQVSQLVIAPWALADDAGRWPLAAFLETGFARAGMIHAALTCCLGYSMLPLRRRPHATGGWWLAAGLAVLVMASGSLLVHGASRIEHSAALMTTTVLHQVAAVVWIGGTMHLTAQWRLLQHLPGGGELWPRLAPRFSPIAMGGVGLLLAAGGYLFWQYIHGTAGLLGTAYGTMLITKVVLMGCALCLGGLNFLTIRQARLSSGSQAEVTRRLPAFVELEAAIGAVILMAAAALTGQPPAIDVLAERASTSEVLWVFAPKMPQWTPAPMAEMLAIAPSALDPFAIPTALGKIQSNFNHNMSGIFVILLGVGALLDRVTAKRWLRHWPLLFLPFALFLLIVAEPTGWPLGPEGFWATLVAPDVLTHRMATLLVVGLGLFQWRVRTGMLDANRWRYTFPLLCGIGGALLLTHSHTVFALKWAFLIEVSHNAIGVLAVMMGAWGWLEQRLDGRESRIAGLAWPVCFTLVGVVLLFYREL
ncbi:MAG TPA: CopD family protein [Desulfuromonadaceae bacterium]